MERPPWDSKARKGKVYSSRGKKELLVKKREKTILQRGGKGITFGYQGSEKKWLFPPHGVGGGVFLRKGRGDLLLCENKGAKRWRKHPFGGGKGKAKRDF